MLNVGPIFKLKGLRLCRLWADSTTEFVDLVRAIGLQVPPAPEGGFKLHAIIDEGTRAALLEVGEGVREASFYDFCGLFPGPHAHCRCCARVTVETQYGCCRGCVEGGRIRVKKLQDGESLVTYDTSGYFWKCGPRYPYGINVGWREAWREVGVAPAMTVQKQGSTKRVEFNLN